MKRIAVTKPEMGVLDHQRPSLSPFGVLAQTFAEEVLARSAWEEGIWPAVPLALLEEEEEHALPALPPKVTLQMDLRLVLEALRRQDSQGVQEKTMERIVERVLERQSSRTEGRKAKEKIPDKAGVPSLTVLGTIHQSFQQHLTQALRVELGQAGAAQRRWTPGRLARQTEAFSRRLQSLREEGGPVGENASLPQGRALRVPEGETRTLERAGVQEAQPQYTIQTAALPAQALEYLQERGDEAAQETLSGQTAALLRQGKELERRLREADKPGQHREETQPGARPPQTPTGPNRAAQPPQELPERTSGETGGAPRASRAGERAAEGAPHGGTAEPAAPWEGSGQPHPDTWRLPIEARDIRVGAAAAQGEEASPQEREEHGLPAHPPVELSHRTEEEGAAGISSGAQRAQEASQEMAGSRLPAQPPVELSHRTEEAGTRPVPPQGGEEQKEKRSGDGTPTGPSRLEESGRPNAWRPPTTARDIRVGPVAAPDQETAAQETARSNLPSHPPVELSHRTEEAGTIPVPPQSREEQKEERSGDGMTTGPSRLEETGRPNPWQPPTTARDIRVGPAAAPDWETPLRETAEQPLPGQFPVELAHRADEGGAIPAPPQGEETHRAERTGNRAATTPAPLEETGQLRTESWQSPATARDIRVGPGPGPDRETPPRHVPGQALLAQPPVELSHRTEPGREGAAEAVEKRGEPFAQHSSPARETAGAEGELPPAWQPTPLITTARDIRVSPTTGAAAQKPVPNGPAQESAAGRLPPPAEGIFGPSGPAAAEEKEILFQSPFRTMARPQTRPPSPAQQGQPQAGGEALTPLTLSYGPAQPASSPPPDPAAGTGQPAEESDYVRSLPDWARRFLKNSAGSPGEHTMGVARDIAALPHPAPEDTVQWTAPNYRPPEAPVTLREKPQQTSPAQAQAVHIPEAEIQRTADRVYRMLEDRIRRERRRLGL